jgi:hypothetical protein
MLDAQNLQPVESLQFRQIGVGHGISFDDDLIAQPLAHHRHLLPPFVAF